MHCRSSLSADKSCSLPPFQTTGLNSKFYCQNGESFCMLAVEYSLVFKFDDVGQPSLCKNSCPLDQQDCGGCSVQWGITSVQKGIDSVLWMVFSTCGGYHQYSGGITSVLRRVFSTMGDTFSTVGGQHQYSEGTTSVQWGITSVLWRSFSTVEIKI